MIAGIDYSREHVDIALLDDTTDAATWHRYPIGGKPDRAFYAARRVRPNMPGATFWDDVWLVGIESGYRGRVNVVRALSLVQGAILASIPAAITVVPTPEEEWKRVFTGHAKASKSDVALAAARRGFFPGTAEQPPVQDAYDAYAIAVAVRALNARAIERGAAA